MAPRRKVPATLKGIELPAVEKALVETRGNVTAAARALRVPSSDLRRLVQTHGELRDAVFEQMERAIDASMSVLWEGLRHENIARRLEAAKLFLRTDAGRRRGW